MRIYTGTGDDGTTGLLGGDRTAKNSDRIAAIGDVDELNAAIGVAAVSPSAVRDDLRMIQNWLFDLGSELACPPGGKFDIVAIHESHIQWLESSIDRQTDALPELKEFILPGGDPVAAQLHLARAVCRRAERSLWRLSEDQFVRGLTVQFLNRLSDWLFVAARTVNAAKSVSDEKWRKAEVPK